MAGSLVTGAGAPTAVVEVQPGMLVQAVTLVDENGLPVSAGIATALATLTTPVVVSAATAPTVNQVLTATSGSAATWQASASGFANPMTTLGDIIYENATPAPARLAGGTVATKQYLTQTGTGSASAAPAWGTIAAGDVPTLNQNTTGTALNVTGTVATTNGGTGQVTAAAAYNALSPMTTTGDIEYESGTNTAARLAGNTTTTPELLSSTGSGAAAAAPVWKSLATLGIAPLASPALTSVPTAPTASALTSNTQIATTAYADSAVAARVVSGQYLCAPAQFAPTVQQIMTTTSQTFGLVTGAASTVAAGSNGGEISQVASWSSPSAGVLAVAAGSAFPVTGGTVNVTASGATTAVVTYTGVSGNTLTGCAYVSGSATGTLATGGGVTLTSAAISTGSFTAPASGTVLITAMTNAKASAGGSAVAFGLAAHGTITPMVGYSVIAGPASAGPSAPILAQFLLTGLSGSYNFDLLWCVASTVTATMYVFAQSTTTPTLSNAGLCAPLIMTVQAV